MFRYSKKHTLQMQGAIYTSQKSNPPKNNTSSLREKKKTEKDETP